MELNNKFKKWNETSLFAIDLSKIYDDILELNTYDRDNLRRIVIKTIYYVDGADRKGFIPILSNYEKMLQDKEYMPITEELLRIVTLIELALAPKTNIDKMYI